MRLLLFFLLVFVVIGAILLAVGVGVGLLLHWLMPSVDLGIGILIGVITIGFTARLFARMVSIPFPLDELEEEAEPVEPLTPQRITHLLDPEPPRRRGRKRRPSPS